MAKVYPLQSKSSLLAYHIPRIRYICVTNWLATSESLWRKWQLYFV